MNRAWVTDERDVRQGGIAGAFTIPARDRRRKYAEGEGARELAGAWSVMWVTRVE
jgi:hypothetical protein